MHKKYQHIYGLTLTTCTYRLYTNTDEVLVNSDNYRAGYLANTYIYVAITLTIMNDLPVTSFPNEKSEEKN